MLLFQASLNIDDKTNIMLLLTELVCHGMARPDFFTLLNTNTFKARSSLLQVNFIKTYWEGCRKKCKKVGISLREAYAHQFE